MNKEYIFAFDVVFVGLDKVGKTCLTRRLIKYDFIEAYQPTIGATYSQITFNVENEKIRLNIWDTGGQEKYRALLSLYMKKSKALVIVFDVTNEKSFNDLPIYIDQGIQNESVELIVIVGNKADQGESRKISREEAEEFAKKYKIHYFEASAKKNEKIDDIITYVVTQLYHSMLINPIFRLKLH